MVRATATAGSVGLSPMIPTTLAAPPLAGSGGREVARVSASAVATAMAVVEDRSRVPRN